MNKQKIISVSLIILLLISIIGLVIFYITKDYMLQEIDSSPQKEEKILDTEGSSESLFNKIPTLDTNQFEEPVDAGSIIFENNGEIHLFDTNKMTTSVLSISEAYTDNEEYEASNLKPGKFQASKGGRYLFFKMIRDIFYPIFKIYVFDLELNKITKIIDFSNDSASPGYWVRKLSPNKTYLGLHFSTGGGAVFAIADFQSSEILHKGTGVPLWSPDETKFVTGLEEFSLVGATAVEAYTYSYYITAINNGEFSSEYLILEANNQIGYDILYWKDDVTLVYAINTYSEPFPESSQNRDEWDRYKKVYINPDITYWKIDVNSLEKEKLLSVDDDLREQALDSGIYSIGFSTDEELGVQVASVRGSDKDWKVIRANNNNGKWEIYLVDKEHTKKIKIGEGNSILWAPDLAK